MTNNQAIERYNELCQNIKENLARLQKSSEENFGIDSNIIDWGHVGTMVKIDTDIKAISDLVFREGEYAQQLTHQ